MTKIEKFIADLNSEIANNQEWIKEFLIDPSGLEEDITECILEMHEMKRYRQALQYMDTLEEMEAWVHEQPDLKVGNFVQGPKGRALFMINCLKGVEKC